MSDERLFTNFDKTDMLAKQGSDPDQIVDLTSGRRSRSEITGPNDESPIPPVQAIHGVARTSSPSLNLLDNLQDYSESLATRSPHHTGVETKEFVAPDQGQHTTGMPPYKPLVTPHQHGTSQVPSPSQMSLDFTRTAELTNDAEKSPSTAGDHGIQSITEIPTSFITPTIEQAIFGHVSTNRDTPSTDTQEETSSMLPPSAHATQSEATIKEKNSQHMAETPDTNAYRPVDVATVSSMLGGNAIVSMPPIDASTSEQPPSAANNHPSPLSDVSSEYDFSPEFNKVLDRVGPRAGLMSDIEDTSSESIVEEASDGEGVDAVLPKPWSTLDEALSLVSLRTLKPLIEGGKFDEIRGVMRDLRVILPGIGDYSIRNNSLKQYLDVDFDAMKIKIPQQSYRATALALVRMRINPETTPYFRYNQAGGVYLLASKAADAVKEVWGLEISIPLLVYLRYGLCRTQYFLRLNNVHSFFRLAVILDGLLPGGFPQLEPVDVVNPLIKSANHSSAAADHGHQELGGLIEKKAYKLASNHIMENLHQNAVTSVAMEKEIRSRFQMDRSKSIQEVMRNVRAARDSDGLKAAVMDVLRTGVEAGLQPNRHNVDAILRTANGIAFMRK